MDLVQVACVSACLLLRLKRQIKRRQKRRWWVHPLLHSRLSTGQFHLKFAEHRKYPERFFMYYRMSLASFDELLRLLCEKLQKRDTNMRISIHPAERLVITLRYLATGSSFACLEYVFHVGQSTIGRIIRETCKEMWGVLQPVEMPCPTEENFIDIAEHFYRKSNFPNCLGALDGKHIRMRRPINSGTEYFNYKKFYSVVLLALTDANYCFTAIDVGAYGRESDSNIFKNSALGTALARKEMNLPTNKALPNTISPELPHIFVGDEAFALSENVLRPFSRRNLGVAERVFNYRLTRARRFVECTFGIFANKWRVFHTSLLVDVDFAIDIIKCACVLHNFVRRRDGADKYDTHQVDVLDNITPRGVGGRSNGIAVRDKYKDYFVSPQGAIPWQYEKI